MAYQRAKTGRLVSLPESGNLACRPSSHSEPNPAKIQAIDAVPRGRIFDYLPASDYSILPCSDSVAGHALARETTPGIAPGKLFVVTMKPFVDRHGRYPQPQGAARKHPEGI